MAVGAGPRSRLADAAGRPGGLGEVAGYRERCRSREKQHQAGQRERRQLPARQALEEPARAAPLAALLSHAPSSGRQPTLMPAWGSCQRLAEPAKHERTTRGRCCGPTAGSLELTADPAPDRSRNSGVPRSHGTGVPGSAAARPHPHTMMCVDGVGRRRGKAVWERDTSTRTIFVIPLGERDSAC